MRTTTWRSEDIIEPGKLRAALFSCLLHIAFLILLVFGFNWKSDVPEAMQVELWSELPQAQPQPVKPEPLTRPVAPRPAPEPAKPSPAQQPVIASSPPPARKPAIAIKEKAEKPAPVKESPKLPDPVKKEVAKPEPVKEPEQPKPAKEPPQKNEVMAREKQQAEALEREKQREQEAMALKAEQSRIADEIAKYKAMIQAKIRNRIVMPPDLPGNPVVEFRVTLLPGGDVLSVALRKSSGYAAFDEAVERAIFLAKPLPLPPDQRLFRAFRDFSLTVHYQE